MKRAAKKKPPRARKVVGGVRSKKPAARKVAVFSSAPITEGDWIAARARHNARFENKFERGVRPHEAWAHWVFSDLGLMPGDIKPGTAKELNLRTPENYARTFLTGIARIRELIRQNADPANAAAMAFDLGCLIGEATAKGVFKGRKKGAISATQKILREHLAKDPAADIVSLRLAVHKLNPDATLTQGSFRVEVSRARRALAVRNN